MSFVERDNAQVARVREIFDAAVVLPLADQPGFVSRECQGEPALRERVLRLLSSDQSEIFPEVLARELEAFHLVREIATPHRFGPYATIERIGMGGMSIVYKARRIDDEYSKIVALKVLPFGLETTERIERFRTERQILADLDHPNIARLLDGGTTSEGVPYLAMELVEGKPLDASARDTEASVEQRLALFLQICEGVKFAHANLVVHCDLKPSNILVTADGTPKLLDFGISKLLDRTKMSRTATAPLMTPEFASPEQVLGRPITTATDIYSLGVLLFVLLTEVAPYRISAADDAHTLSSSVCEQDLDFEAASDLDPDLRSIIRMATRKEVARRYTSVEQLAADIRCFLARQPVMARRGSTFYRWGKFARRNRIAIAASVVFVTGLGLAFGSQWRESQRANRRFDEVRDLARFLVFDTFDAVSQLPKSAELRRKIVAQSLKYLDTLARESPNDPKVLNELGESYVRLARAQGFPGASNLGDTQGALASLEKARTAFESLVRIRPTAHSRGALCLALEELAPVLSRAGRAQEAVEAAERYLQLATDLLAARPQSAGHHLRVNVARIALGGALLSRAQASRSMPDIQRSTALYAQVLDDLPLISEVPENLTGYATDLQLWALMSLASVHCQVAKWTGDRSHYIEALHLQERGLRITREILAKNSGDLNEGRMLAEFLADVGHTLSELDRFSQAESAFQEALSEFKLLTEADPADAENQRETGDVYLYQAKALRRIGKEAASRRVAAKAVLMFEPTLKRDPLNGDVKSALIEARELWAR